MVRAYEPRPTPAWQVVGGVIIGGGVIAIAVAAGVLALAAVGVDKARAEGSNVTMFDGLPIEWA